VADPSAGRPPADRPADVTESLAESLQITHLLTHYSERPIWALFMFLNGFITIALWRRSWCRYRSCFPRGPTAFLFFFCRAPAAALGFDLRARDRHRCGYGAL
jgi:hypothetical protein